MSTPEDQLSSFNALRAVLNPPDLSPEMQRVFWTLDGPLSESIWIMENEDDPDSLDPYFKGDDEKQSWHAASRAPLTEPPVSSITVKLDDMEEWEDNWLDWHQDHSPGAGTERYEDGELTVLWGELPDYDEKKDKERQPRGHLLMCCGTTRPRGKSGGVVVTPTVGDFVTVHDYLSTVHPWLLSKRDDILAAMGMFDDEPLPQETQLMVSYGFLDSLSICERAEWVGRRQKRKQYYLKKAAAAE